jgi:hypothetical protein
MKRLALCALLCGVLPAMAQYQVRTVPVKITPFYVAPEHRADPPRVLTNSGFDRLLSSVKREDIAKVHRAVNAEPDSVSPITLMVLAIRAYDVGMRDEAVVWYYVARERMATASAVLDASEPELARIRAGTRAFALQAGPTINGYALCDPQRYAAQRRQALDWVEKHPYAMIFVDAVPAKPGDRRANLAASIRALRSEMEEDIAALATPEAVAKRSAARKETGADQKYCW